MNNLPITNIITNKTRELEIMVSSLTRDNCERFVASMLSWTCPSSSGAAVEVEKDKDENSCTALYWNSGSGLAVIPGFRFPVGFAMTLFIAAANRIPA